MQRIYLALISVFLVQVQLQQQVHAQNYPTKPIKLIVGFSAGSGADVTARLVAQELTRNLQQQVLVENRPGGAGSIATNFVAKSPKDGYTILLLTASDTILLALRQNLPYDLVRDLSPVSQIANGMYVLVVHPSLPVKSVKELVALAKSVPGKLNYGTSGIGSSSHLAGELLKSMAKVNIVPVPYKSATAGAIATATGEIAMNFPSVPAALTLVASKKVRALAVTGKKRTPLMAATPTISESGFNGYDRSTWHALAVPNGVPQEIVSRLNTAVKRSLEEKSIKDLFLKQGIEAETSTSEELAAHIAREIDQNEKLVKLIGISPQ